MDYIAEAKQLVQNLDQRMGPSPYDIGWMARVKTPDGDPRWPDLIDWLLENQHPDGSWGGQIEYYHDRIICTLVSAIALYENGHNAQSQGAIKRAEYYIWHHLHLLPRDPFELVGFELIVPTLLGEAAELGLDVPNHTCGYGEIQTAKLKLIPLHMLYSPRSSTVYSLEFLGHKANKENLQKIVNANGAIGNSPAATAYYLTLCPDDERAIAYLDNLKPDHIITVYPFRTFELGWVLGNFIACGLPPEQLVAPQVLSKLHTAINPNGVGFDPTFTVPDGDTTSVCAHVLLKAGYEIDPAILIQFEATENHVFQTYNYERNVSVGTNVHALEAINLIPNYPNLEQLKKHIAIMLLNQRKYNMYWIDKWHASPYYATAHALVALTKEALYLAHACKDTLDWLLHTQRQDGSWGFFTRGTLEETAYVLNALLHYHQIEPIDPDVLHRGATYLMRTYRTDKFNYPSLWIAKPLYTPYDIIKSAALSALILYNKTFT
ncbi:MAG: hypothetical protein K8R89_09765 [Anaerolineae bacterium]|nr:hypothetical protein [Anaerolineae bacterium]